MKILSFHLASASLAMLLTSCQPVIFYQVYDVETPGMQITQNAVVYENTDCVITYSLWREGGDLSFVFTNKTNENLYLIMPECFLIQNGWALDYYDDNTYTNMRMNSLGASVAAQATLFGYTSHSSHWHPAALSRSAALTESSNYSSSVTYKAPEKICIPANSSKVITGFSISKTVHLECEAKEFNFPKKISQEVEYSKEDTPLSLLNVIAYCNNPDGNSLTVVENEFWVRSYTNYAEKEATSSYQIMDCKTKAKFTRDAFIVNTPTRFYNSYTKMINQGSIVVDNKNSKKDKNKYVHDDIYRKRVKKTK